MSTSIIQMSDKTKGETVEKERRSKNSLKSKTKSEERENIFYYILSMKWKRNTKWFNIFRRLWNTSRNHSHKRNKDIK